MRVNNIFLSISGECGSIPQGSLTSFVRFYGCNLACNYCDAKEAVVGHKLTDMSPNEIVQQLLTYDTKRVVLTGGEPLLQNVKELSELYSLLKYFGFYVQMETNGTLLASCIVCDCAVIDFKQTEDVNTFFEVIRSFKSMTTSTLISDKLMLPKEIYIKYVVNDVEELNSAFNIMDIVNKDIGFSNDCALWHAVSLQDSNSNVLLEWGNVLYQATKTGISNIILNLQIHKEMLLK